MLVYVGPSAEKRKSPSADSVQTHSADDMEIQLGSAHEKQTHRLFLLWTAIVKVSLWLAHHREGKQRAGDGAGEDAGDH